MVIRVAYVCVILVGDFTSWVKPSSVIVESQEECGFSKSILKYPSTSISAWGLTVSMLSITCKSCQATHKKQTGFCIKTKQKQKPTNIRSVRTWFQFKPNAFKNVTFKVLTPVCNVSNRVVYVYCNTSLSNNS